MMYDLIYPIDPKKYLTQVKEREINLNMSTIIHQEYIEISFAVTPQDSSFQHTTRFLEIKMILTGKSVNIL